MTPSSSASAAANQSVERGAAVLRAFLDTNRTELRVSDVAKAIGLNASTTSRLLATLESVEFVERDYVTQLYRLGPALITLGSATLNQHAVYREARQVAQNLAADFGVGANVATRRGNSLFYLCNFEGRKAPKSFDQAGRRNPLHATGLGKCLLFDADLEGIMDVVRGSVAFTKHTILDGEAFSRELEASSLRGYATEVEELALGRACIAAPIRGRSGRVVAAMSLSGPLTALDLDNREKELAATLIEAADSISIALGYTSHPPRDVAV